ncbi:MAG TPA: hypothetical protein DF480_03215 [Clostridiales bacterium]|nr:hypothetical protein [Clostridiales bacterium]
MKRRMRIFLIVTAALLLSTSLVLAVSVDSVLVFDAGDLPDTYKGFLLKGISSDGGSSYPFSDDFTVSYNSADAQEYYTLLMVKASVNESGGLDAPYEITEDNILYIDQKSSEVDGSISFDVRPSSVESSVFLLGGSFDQSGETSPVMLGAVHLSGVEISGTLEYSGSSIPTITLTPAVGPALQGVVSSNTFLISGVPSGTYTLDIQKIGHLLYHSNLVVSDVGIVIPLITLKGGDTNADLYVNASDLSNVLGQFGSSGISENGCDINEDTYINASDLSIVLANFGQSTY